MLLKKIFTFCIFPFTTKLTTIIMMKVNFMYKMLIICIYVEGAF